MNYLDFFHLHEEPFSNAPNADFYYGSLQHERALLRLSYAASTMKGLAVCVGEIGAGKTTLARRMLDSLPESQYEAALLVIIHSGITAGWLLKRISLQLGVERPADEKLKLLSQLYQRLVQIHDEGKKAIVLIDEAQMLETREIMEEFRGMLNLEIPGHKLITFVMFGLPDLEQKLKLDEPLNQRVAVRCRLSPFTVPETVKYVRHRMRLADGESTVFTDDALQVLQNVTGGVPRLINTTCDNLLLEAWIARSKKIQPGLVYQVARDLGLVASASNVQPLVAAAGGMAAPAAAMQVVEIEDEFDLRQALVEPTPVIAAPMVIDDDATPVTPSPMPVLAEQVEAAQVLEEIDDFEEDELEIPRIDALDDIDSILDQLDES